MNIWGTFDDHVGDLLCIFLTFYGPCGPFEDFWKTCGPEDLKALKNFLDLLMTSCGTFEDLSPLRNSRTFQDHWGSLRTWLPTEELRTLINFWGHWGRFEYLLTTFEEFEDIEDLFINLRIIWGPVAWERSGPFVIFLTFWGLCVPFEDFFKTWGPEDLKALKNVLDLLMTSGGPFEDCF